MSDLKQKLGNKVQALEPAEVAGTVAEVAPADMGYVALSTNAMEIIRENLKSQSLTSSLFDVIKSPSGGVTAFAVPSLAGEELEKEITGIILDYTTPRAYWDTPDPVEGTPPICFSRDSVVSTNGERCLHCVHNSFGSKDGDTNAKACKESVELLMLRPDSIMPVIVRVPVSSKLLFQRYSTRLIGKLTPIHGVITKITLSKATNKTGQPYATYNFEVVRQLNADEIAQVKAYSAGFKAIMQTDEVVHAVPPTAPAQEQEAA